MFIALAVANVLSVPQLKPIDLYYPGRQLSRRHSTAALVDVLVDPEGKPVSCDTLQIFGDEEFGQTMCKSQSVFRYQPAIDAQGKPSYGIVRVLIKFVMVGSEQGKRVNRLTAPVKSETFGAIKVGGGDLPDFEKFTKETGGPETVTRPDVTFQLASLPEGAADHLDQGIIVAVDETAMVTRCEADENLNAGTSNGAYAKAACSSLLGSRIGNPVVVDGTAVSYVRPLLARFTVKPSG